MSRWIQSKLASPLLLTFFLIFVAIDQTVVIAQSDRETGVVGDCVAILFVDPQQPESQPMEEVAAQAIEIGWAFRRVDAREETHVAQRWRIHTTPTIVLVRSGREVDRILGPVNWIELSRRMLKLSSADSLKVPKSAPMIRSASVSNVNVDSLVPMQPRPVEPKSLVPAVTAKLDPPMQQSVVGDPQAATVRIVVDEPDSHAVGSGTIVHSTQQGALVLTCGHLFRDWTKQSVITVERFENGAPVKYAAQLIDYQIDDVDIGVLAINPGKAVPSASVASQVDSVQEGEPVFSIGCDHGDIPSRRDSRVTKLNRYLGSPNIETAGLPVQGRSGGGLFNRRGELVGICFAADSELDEGLYCGTQCLLERLSKIGISSNDTIPKDSNPNNRTPIAPNTPPVMAASSATAPFATAPPATASTATIILTDSSGSTRQLTIVQPSEKLMDAIQEESQRTRQANATSQVRWKTSQSAGIR